jgi:uncharacterized protein
MTIRPVLLIAAASFGALAALPAHAASFDCRKARQADEKAICASRTLSELDVQMAALYGVRMQLPMMMGSRGAAQDEQARFLADRAACGAKTSCLANTYQSRIAALKTTLSAGMHDYCVRIGLCG